MNVSHESIQDELDDLAAQAENFHVSGSEDEQFENASNSNILDTPTNPTQHENINGVDSITNSAKNSEEDNVDDIEPVIIEEYLKDATPAADEKEQEDDDDDDDFGSFDEASFEDFEEPTIEEVTDTTTLNNKNFAEVTSDGVTEDSKSSISQANNNLVSFHEEVFNDNELFHKKLEALFSTVFPELDAVDDNYGQIHDNEVDTDLNSTTKNTSTKANTILSERSSVIFTQLSTMPHLSPPNWTRSKIRHNLLISLGVPINLDEMTKSGASGVSAGTGTSVDSNHLSVDSANSSIGKRTLSSGRRKSISAADISWDGFDIPDFETLGITADAKNELLLNTSEILSRIETDNLSNSSERFLLDEHTSEDLLSGKLEQFQKNYNSLIQLASVWNNNLSELTKDFEIYESVVQNYIGYSQKLRRDEILENLKRVKSSKARKRRLWN
ncbi:uncharacterized protein RJT20DRAFT_26028 [Scheffersomyces xylosifermentans]|uniref:uncharacterized protein n=1 Tax=Scheffersomyces xylosifermentans TaxID=1304137 RepID=UPI00315CF13D